jgi:hypothetical protein
LDTAFGVRSKDLNRLFVPIKMGQNDITAKAISSWIYSTVMLAYKSSGIILLNSLKVLKVGGKITFCGETKGPKE